MAIKKKKAPSRSSSKVRVTKPKIKILPPSDAFPVVGIGASAGGLDALKDLFKNLPPKTGMAFVIIQHLDPSHPSMSAEIISRATKMPVREVQDGMSVEPNHVYVIPSNCNLGFEKGTLKILPRTLSRGQHMPLDFFFQTFSDELKSKAIGVVLSGTASDGTRGVRSIKANGGITLVQDPQSAKFDGMPRSAIASGAVDFIRTPKGIASELSRIANHPYVTVNVSDAIDEVPLKKEDSLAKIFLLVRKQTNVDFSHYKKNTINRRIARRMLVQKTKDLNRYANFLENNPEEINALFSDVLIHVTSFFRDKKVFETLKTKILPKYMKNWDPNATFRIWVAGCSTGEEVYSLAMIFMEFQEEYFAKEKTLNARIPLSIFGTDISEQALQKARAAIYPDSIIEDVSKERLRKFFEKVDGGGYRIAKWLRECCLFSKHDITRDPPFAKVDFISCRNVLIYFDSELQKFVFPVFHYALKPGGILLLGKSETVGAFSNLFNLADKSNKAYIKKNIPIPLRIKLPVGRQTLETITVPPKRGELPSARIDLQREFDRVALSEYAPPSVVINDALEIVQSRGRTSPFLELSSGLPSLNILRMAHPELVTDLRSLIQSARKKNIPVSKKGVYLRNDKDPRSLTIKIVPITTPGKSKERHFTVFFEDSQDAAPENIRPQGRALSKKVKDLDLKRDLQHVELKKKLAESLEYQQSLVEEYETSQEELVSSNEELQSTNEELQSTNEELETAKEELQSTNEELITVNDELQVRNNEMSGLNNDLSNLLASVDIPIIMVGSDGTIRRYTPKAGKALKLIPTDIGRPIGDIKPNLEIPDLDEVVSEVMESMSVKQFETQDKQGHWYQLQVRPYRTSENKIDGAVIALIDIDSHKRNAEVLKNTAHELKLAKDDAETIINSQPIPLLVLDSHQKVKIANESFYQHFQVSKTVTEGFPISELGSSQWNIPELSKLIDATLFKGEKFEHFEVDCDFPTIGRRVMLLSSKKVQLAGSGETAVLLTMDDVTKRMMIEKALKASEEKYRNLIANAYEGIVIVSEDNKIELVNQRIEKMFGYSSDELLHRSIDNLFQAWPKVFYIANLELIGRRKDGSEFPLEVSVSPTKTPDGICLTAILRDITERKEIEKERAEILVKEQKANQVKDEFLAMLSHELRTPLATILGWVELMRKGKLDTEKTKHAIEIVEKSAKTQAQLINDLLDISRIQAGKMSLNIQEIDPAKVVFAAIESTQSPAAYKSIHVETLLDSSIKSMFADPIRLQQILWNLISNAIKFSPVGSKVLIKLTRLLSATGDIIQFQVIDNGKGIKPDFLPFVFERFTQVDSTSTRAYGGLGLGLAIVRKLVEMHTGKISVESLGENKGSTFTVSLPAKPALPTQKAFTLDQGESEMDLSGLKILLVDDEEPAREVFCLILESFNAEVKTAGSAAEALVIFKDFKPDVLVSDIAMPLEDGYSLIAKIRALNPKVPALALSAYAGQDEINRMLAAGFHAHAAKPVDASKLARAIADLVGRK